MKKEQVLINFTEVQITRLRKVSEATGVSVNELVRQAVQIWIYKHSQTLIDSFSEVNSVVGVMESIGKQ